MQELLPHPEHETPNPVPTDLKEAIIEGLLQQHGQHIRSNESLEIDLHTGADAAFLKLTLGDRRRSHVFEIFAREVPGDDLDGALGLVVDYCDGILKEFFAAFRDAWLPLDYTQKIFDGKIIFIRHALRDFHAEALADKLLTRE